MTPPVTHLHKLRKVCFLRCCLPPLLPVNCRDRMLLKKSGDNEDCHGCRQRHIQQSDVPLNQAPLAAYLRWFGGHRR